LIGYWHNFENGSGFIKLRDISRDFDVINLSFRRTRAGRRSLIQFVPDVRTSAAEIQSGRRAVEERRQESSAVDRRRQRPRRADTEADKQNFINSVSGLVTQYGLNGIDIDSKAAR